MANWSNLYEDLQVTQIRLDLNDNAQVPQNDKQVINDWGQF